MAIIRVNGKQQQVNNPEAYGAAIKKSGSFVEYHIVHPDKKVRLMDNRVNATIGKATQFEDTFGYPMVVEITIKNKRRYGSVCPDCGYNPCDCID